MDSITDNLDLNSSSGVDPPLLIGLPARLPFDPAGRMIISPDRETGELHANADPHREANPLAIGRNEASCKNSVNKLARGIKSSSFGFEFEFCFLTRNSNPKLLEFRTEF